VRLSEKTGDTKLLSILKQKTEDVEVKRFAQTLMRDSGSLEYTRRRCTALKAEVLAAIEVLGGHEKLKMLIEKLDQQIDGVATDEGEVRGGEPQSAPKSPAFNRIDSASN